MKKLRYLFLLASIFPSQVYAAIIPPINDSTARVSQSGFAPGVVSNLNNIITILWGRVFRIVFIFLAVAAIIMLIYSGIQYITSGSGQEKTKAARQNIINVVAGIVLLVATYFIIDFIISLATKVASSTS